MENLEIKYLIIGAGISGLTFAQKCKNEFLIVEKIDSVGGYCKTFYVKDYVWDYAGHFYHFKNDSIKEKFLSMYSPNELVLKDKNTKIMYKDKLINYPFQTNIHQLEKEEFIDCLYDLYNKDEKQTYDNFVDMLYGKFGVSIVKKFLKPYNEKLYATDLKNLDVDAMGRFFPYADVKQIINNMKSNDSDRKSYNSTFLYPKKGAQTYINKIYSNLDSKRVMLNTAVTKIDLKNKEVYTNNNKKIKYKYLINTSPLTDFLGFINEYKLKNKLSYNKVLVFNMGFKKASKFKEDWIYIPDKSVSFYRIGFYNNILGKEKLSVYIELGFSKDENIDVDYYYNKVMQDMKKLGIIEDNELDCYNYLIMDPAYVHINEETSTEIHNLFAKLQKNNIYSIGRYGAWTYCSMEDCIVMANSTYESIDEIERNEDNEN